MWRGAPPGGRSEPVAIPPPVMGMGLIRAYNWPWFSLVGTWQLLLVAHAIYLAARLAPVAGAG